MEMAPLRQLANHEWKDEQKMKITSHPEGGGEKITKKKENGIFFFLKQYDKSCSACVIQYPAIYIYIYI